MQPLVTYPLKGSVEGRHANRSSGTKAYRGLVWSKLKWVTWPHDYVLGRVYPYTLPSSKTKLPSLKNW
jgi:hypothetical protein